MIKTTVYPWIQRTLIRFDYDKLKRTDKGLTMQYLIKINGYSRKQLTLLTKQYRHGGKVVRRQCTTHGFTSRYTDKDIQLLARLEDTS